MLSPNNKTLFDIHQEQLSRFGYSNGQFSTLEEAISSADLNKQEEQKLLVIRDRLWSENAASGLFFDLNFLRAAEFYHGSTRLMSQRPEIAHPAGMVLLLDNIFLQATKHAKRKLNRKEMVSKHALYVATPPHDIIEDIAKHETNQRVLDNNELNENTIRASIRQSKLGKLRQFYEVYTHIISKEFSLSKSRLNEVWKPVILSEGLVTRGSYSVKYQANNYFTYMIGMDLPKQIAGMQTTIRDNMNANLLKAVDFLDNLPSEFPDAEYLQRNNLLTQEQLKKAEKYMKNISAEYLSAARKELEQLSQESNEKYVLKKLDFTIQNKELVQGFEDDLELKVRYAKKRAVHLMWSAVRNDRGYDWAKRIASLSKTKRRKIGISDITLSALYHASVQLSEQIRESSRLDMNHHFVYNPIAASQAKTIEQEVKEYLQTPNSKQWAAKSENLPEHLRKYDSFSKLAISLAQDESKKLSDQSIYEVLTVANGLAERNIAHNSVISSIEEYKKLFSIDGDITKAA